MQSNTPNDRRDGSCRSLQSVTGRVTAWPTLACLLGLLAMSIAACGCTSVSDYIHNGFKVGPNYGRPPAPVAKDWIDADDMRVRKDSDDLTQWWTVFHDPVLESLIC